MAMNTTVGRTTNRQKIRQYLRDFNFKTLFVEELGWDILGERPLTVPVDGIIYVLWPLVEKRGVRVYICEPNTAGNIPTDRVLRKIEREVVRYAYEHVIISVDAARKNQVWLWVKREQGKRLASRLHRYHQGQSGELLAQKLEQLAIGLEEEELVQMAEVAGRVARAFDVERVTKKFYEHFKREHAAFLNLIGGIGTQADREWYASLMLNRLMFIYFIQRKGFLDTRVPDKLDGDLNYLSNRLRRVQQERGENQFHTFYRYFLLKLFHEGLSQRDHTLELEALLGKVPYLNGGLFDVHVLEHTHPQITIPDQAFEQLFAFFDEFDWHLDDRPLRNDREINPDVLGYIFEKYINQKQMGAYYTKEDITEYINKNTIIPFLFEATEQQCRSAFHPDGPVWLLLRENPDTYIYDAVKKGCAVPMPPAIEAGIRDVAQRSEWNKPAPEVYALPTETWREVVARRTCYQELRAKLAVGEIVSANDLITYNLDNRRFAEDVITYCTDTDLLRALYESIEHVTVLDPTCGSGAFLFSALGILEGLYEACLDRMQDLIEEREILDAATPQERRLSSPDIVYFRVLLERVKQHPSRSYFIYKSIVIRNLYGVDIMEEATEICKLRLFLKLVSQIERFDDIEPLPDIDFNIRAGNTLVGFASYEETKQAIEGKAMGKGATQGETAFQNQMIFDDRLERIEQKAQDIERAFGQFRERQIEQGLGPSVMVTNKQQLQQMLGILRLELDGYLASEYGIDRNSIRKREEYEAKFAQWQHSHLPFHWWVEFYGIMKQGGFDVIVGNPPYVEYNDKHFAYTLRSFATRACGNLYTCVIERSHQLLSLQSRHGMILPLAAFATKNMIPLIEVFKRWFPSSWLSFYHFRPSMLFSGGKVASIPTTIYIAKAGGPEQRFSTHLAKWSTVHRDMLFPLLTYCQITTSRDLENRHYYPKFGYSLENTIMEKVLQHKQVGSYLSSTLNQNTMYYRSAGGLYWKVLINFMWPYQTTSNKQCNFQEGYERDVFVVLFNSSLFWWYYTSTFDTFNLKDYMIFGFRFTYPEDQKIINVLRVQCQSLMNDFRTHAEHLKRGKTGSYTVYARKSKPIIDEIDRVFAEHYGFTDEELDFIINYDIKYRLGQSSTNEEEE